MKAATLASLAGLALIVLGVAALAWPEFSYVKDTHDAKLGPLEFTVKEKESVRIPVWAGIGAVAAGTFLLLRSRKQA
ncbi:MAG TPA: hypothetical protein VGK03_10710 [Geothrix sp.]|jgi:hypothetical protein